MAYVLTSIADIPFTELTRDPVGVLGGEWYVGLLSQLTVLTAGSSAAIGLFVANHVQGGAREETRRMLLWLSVGIGYFAIDDLLLLHEVVGPAVGVSEFIMVAIYPCALGGFLWRFWNRLIGEDLIAMFSVGVGFLSLSAGVDVVDVALPVPRALLEDPSKIAGIALLSVYAHLVGGSVTEARWSR